MEKKTLKEMLERINKFFWFTYNVNQKEFYEEKKGYAVSITWKEKKVKEENFNEEVIEKYIKENEKILKKPGYYLWAWWDDGYIYLDVYIITDRKEESERIAKENKQLVYYDFKNFENINIDKE